MKFSALVFFLLFTFLFTFTVFSQNVLQSNNPEDKISILWKQRSELLKADILKDIKFLPTKNQSQYYAELGQIFWYKEKNKKEGIFWLTKAVNNALNPATNYNDSLEKVDVLSHILFYFDISKKDTALGQRLIAAITETLYEEVKTKGSDDFSDELISLARKLITIDENLAFDFAMLSLKGKKPAVNRGVNDFFVVAKLKNEALLNLYFSKLVEVVKTGGNRNLLESLMTINSPRFNYRTTAPYISETQKIELLEVLFPFIKNEAAELFSKKRNDCNLTRSYGVPYLDDFKKFLPTYALTVEQAINICKTANIEEWKKPDFFKSKNLKTSQEILDFAKELPEKEMQTNWLYSAALRAETEKNYRFGINILDSIEPPDTKDTFTWQIIRSQITSNLFLELLQNGNVEEAQLELKNAPPALRPNIISRLIFSLGNLKNKNKQITYDLLNQMRSDIERPEFYSKDRSRINKFDPDNFFKLSKEYYYLGYPNDALSILENYSKIQNQMSNRIDSENDSREYFGFSFAPVFPGRIVEDNYDSIYQIFDNIESVKMRLKLRCILLNETVNSLLITLPNTKQS